MQCHSQIVCHTAKQIWKNDVIQTIMMSSWHGNAFRITGVGVTKPIFSVPLFSTFPLLSKQTLAIEYHVYIWQVSPQLSCGDTCQIWMWFRESNRYFCKIENFAYGEISERSFSNPYPLCNRWIALTNSHVQSFHVLFDVDLNCWTNSRVKEAPWRSCGT